MDIDANPWSSVPTVPTRRSAKDMEADPSAGALILRQCSFQEDVMHPSKRQADVNQHALLMYAVVSLVFMKLCCAEMLSLERGVVEMASEPTLREHSNHQFAQAGKHGFEPTDPRFMVFKPHEGGSAQ